MELFLNVHTGSLSASDFARESLKIWKRYVVSMNLSQICDTVHFLSSMNVMVNVVTDERPEELVRAMKAFLRCGCCSGTELVMMVSEVIEGLQRKSYPTNCQTEKFKRSLLRLLQSFSQETRAGVVQLRKSANIKTPKFNNGSPRTTTDSPDLDPPTERQP